MTGAVGGAPDGGWGWVVALGAALVQMQVERSMALTMPDVSALCAPQFVNLVPPMKHKR